MDADRRAQKLDVEGMKMVRRARFMALVTVLVIGVTACGKNDTGQTTAASEPTAVSTALQEETTTEAEKEMVRVCVMYDEKSLNTDREACEAYAKQAAAEFDVELVSTSWNLDSEEEEKFRKVCAEGYDLIIGTSAGFADWITEYAEEYSETDFMVLDAVVESSNVKSVSVSQKEGYFLAGAAAAVIAGGIETESKENAAAIGWVNNIDIPVFQEWFAAYEQGAKYVNPEIQVLWSVSGQWEDLEIENVWVAEQMEQGATAVMYVPFDITESGTEAMAGNRLLSAGLLQDEYKVGTVVWTPDESVYAAIEDISQGDFSTGYTQNVSLLDGMVNFALSESLEKIFGDVVAGEIRVVCEELAEKICAGEIVVSGERAEEAAATGSDALDKGYEAY